jgi:hypothetical protein
MRVDMHTRQSHFKRPELSPLEFQTLDFVVQGIGLRDEFCHSFVGKGFSSNWHGRAQAKETETASVPQIP